MKNYAKTVLALGILGLILLNGCNQEKSMCYKSGGSWKVFDNNGTNKCKQKGVGGEVITSSCECSPAKCWNGEKCIAEENESLSNNSNQKNVIDLYCNNNEDCDWFSINCCLEEQGAEWECINKKESKFNCLDKLSCYTYVSHKPQENCKCVNSKCAKE